MSTPVSFMPRGTAKSDATEERVSECRTTLLRSPCIDSHAAAVHRNEFSDHCWEALPERTLALGSSKREKSGDRQLRRLEKVADERRSHRCERRRLMLPFACAQASTISQVRVRFLV